jgi:hypothetical protein
MDPPRHLTQLLQSVGEALRHVSQGSAQFVQPTVNLGRGPSEIGRERDQLVLRSVVQVALDPPPAFIRSGDHPSAGGSQLVAHRRVLNRSGDQVGEARQSLLGISRECPLLGCGGIDAPNGSVDVRRRFAPHQLRDAHAVEMSREGVALVVIQRRLGHADLGITSTYLRGIDNTEIIQTVHERPAPMIPATASLTPRR